MSAREAAVRLRAAPRIPAGTAALVGAAPLLVLAGAAVAHGYAVPVAETIAVACGFALGLTRWRWSVYALLAYLPFSGVAVIALYPHTAKPVLLKDVLFVLPAYAGFAGWALSNRIRVGFRGAPVVLLVLIAVLVLAQALNPALPNRFVGAIGVKVWLLYLPLLFVGYHLVRSRRDLGFLLAVMSLAAIAPLVLGIVEAVLVNGGHADLVYGYYGRAAAAATQNFASFNLDGGGSIRRVSSTFSFVSQYYVFAASAIAVAYAWWRGFLARGPYAWFGRTLWLLAVVAAFTTGARGAFVFVPVLIVLVVLLEGGRLSALPLRVLTPLAALTVAASVFHTGFRTVAAHAAGVGRHEFWDVFVGGFRHALTLTWAGLGTGIDTNASRYAFPSGYRFDALGGRWLESWYVRALVELGVVGLVLVCLLLGVVVVRAWRSHLALRDPRLKAVSAALLALLLWNLAYCVKGQYLDIDPANVYFWLFAGVLLKLPALEREEAE